MMALPPVLPDMDAHRDLRLPADHWVRHHSNDYSVHPKAVGRRVHVQVDDTTVTVTLGKETVARHDRVLASHVTVTDPAHDKARKAARALAEAPKCRRRRRRGRAARPGRLRPGHRCRMSGARDLTYLCRELKHPSLLAGVERLAGRARDEAWSHEEFLAACLEREVSARQSHGGDARIRSARFPARKTLEDFDFEHQRSRAQRRRRPPRRPRLHRSQIQRRVPRPARHRQDRTCPSRSASGPAWPAIASRSPPPPNGSTVSAPPTTPGNSKTSCAAWAASRWSSSTRSATSRSRARPPTCSSSWCRPDTSGPASS